MTAERTLIVEETRMDPALAELVHRTCAFTGVECRPWNGVERLDELAGRAALAIGVLPAGERRIPGALAGLVTEQLPGLPLVLLAQEPLVRPLVSLDGGRVTLLEAPLQPALLAGCTRSLLAEITPDQHGWWAAAAADGAAIDRREYRVGRSWVGVLDCDGSRGWSQRPLPWLHTGRDKLGPALAAILTLADATGQPIAERIPGEGASVGETLVGPMAAVELHSRGDRAEWVFPTLTAHPSADTPSRDAAVGLYSPLRLPGWTELRQSQGGAVVRLGAATGDLVVAVAPAASWLEAARHEAGAGGPALLDALEAALQKSPTPFSCVAVELS